MRKPILLFCLAGLLPAAEPVKVQITTGGHPYDMSFYGVFEGRTDLAVTVNPHPSSFRRDLRKPVDVLVLYDLYDVDEPRMRANLRDFVEAGKGIVVLHHALADSWQWKWWYEEVVGGRFLMGQDGAAAQSKAKNNEVLDCRPVAKHPVLRGVGEMKLDDEAYSGMWLSPRSKVLIETTNPQSDKVVAWIGPAGNARVVAIQMGHGPATHKDAGFRRLVHNAILWAAGRLN